MEGHWVILARVFRVPPAQAVVEEAGDPAQVEEHAAVGEAEGAAQPQAGHAAVAEAEEAAAGEAEVAPHAPAVHAVVGPQAEQAALEEPEHAEVAAEDADVHAGVEAPHGVVGPQAEQAAVEEPEQAEAAAQGAVVEAGVEAPHAVVGPQEEQAALQEPENVEVAAEAGAVAAQGAAAHEGLEAPHAVVGLQELLEQRITDVDRAAAEVAPEVAAAVAAAVAWAVAAGLVAEPGPAEPDFVITVAPPARVTFLTAGNSSHPDPTKPDMFPYIVATGSFGLLARFSPYHGTNFNVRPRASYLVVVRRFRNGANCQIVASAEYVPRRTRNVPVLNSVEGVGFVCNDVDRTYKIAELVVTTGSRFHSAALVCFRSDTARWSKRELSTPAQLRVDGRAWVPHGTVAVNNSMIWYDLSWGLLICDDLDGQGRDGLRFYNLPSGRGRTGVVESMANIHARRCIALSGNYVRYVEVIVPNNPGEAATVSMWYRTPVSDNGQWQWQWSPNYSVSFHDIRNHQSYIDFNLPQNGVPDLVCISPLNPNVLYFAHGQRLFGVDVPSHMVLHCDNCNLVDVPQQPQQASGRFIIPWNLQPIAEYNIGYEPEQYETLPEDVSDDEVQQQEQDEEGPSLRRRGRRGPRSVTITPVNASRYSVPVPYFVTFPDDED